MLLRHGPAIRLDEYDYDCPTCHLTLNSKSWVFGKGHVHPKMDPLQMLFNGVYKGTYILGKGRTRKKMFGQKP